MRLLHGAVHKHRASRTEVYGRVGEKPEFCELLNAVTERFGKSLQERSAPRGTRFVQEKLVYKSVSYLKALHVLSADIENEIDVGAEFFGGGVVRDGFHKPVVYAKRAFYHVFAVARNRRPRDFYIGVFRVKLF